MYPLEYRDTAYHMYTNLNMSMKTISDCLRVSKSIVCYWINHRHNEREKKRRESFFFQCSNEIKILLLVNPQLKLREIRKCIKEKYGKTVSISTIRSYVRKLGFTNKKVSWHHYNKLDDKKAKVLEFENKLKTIDKENIICLDESYFYDSMESPYGWSMRGKKCHMQKRIHKVKYSLLMAISINRIASYNVSLENYNRHNFYDFLKKLLPCFKGKYILMDNASFHKCKEIKQLIMDSGNYVLYIPPYSPEYNPIEKIFHSMKSKVTEYSEINTVALREIIDNLNCGMMRNLYRDSFDR